MQQPKIIVAIRKRPLSKKQQGKGDTDIIAIKNDQTLIVSEYKQKVDLTKYLQETVFNFDFAFNELTTNQQIYQSAVRPLVQSAFQGAKVTCFAYGQTGSGKTHTMNGQPSQGIPGLYTLGAQDIFSYLQDVIIEQLSQDTLICQSDYLSSKFIVRQQLKIRQDNKSNINIIGLQQAVITTWEQFIEYLNYGAAQRVTSQNSANADSSRSHAILQITLKQGKKIFGKISFIDLAGNERGADHMDMNKQTRIDGAQINKSLLSLKECIRALDQGKGHTPFRGSKLTMVLKDSFVGFCRTLMIGNISPSSASSQNTLNTLRYADRVKQLRKPQQLVSKQEMKAKELMLPRQNKNAIKIDINKDDDMDDINKKREDAQKNYGIMTKDDDPYGNDINHTRRGSFNNNNNLAFGNNQKNNNYIAANQSLKGSFVGNPQQPNITSIRSQVPINHPKPSNINNITTANTINNNNNNNKRPNIINEIQKTQPRVNYKGYNQQPHTLNRINSYQLPNDRLYDINQNYSTRMDIENGQIGIKTTNYIKVNNNTTINNNPKQISNQIPNQGYNQYGINNYQQPTSNPYNPHNYHKINSYTSIPISQLPQQQHQQLQQQQPPSNEYQVPNNWDEAIEAILNTQNHGYLLKLQQSIGQNLVIEETSLMENHSMTLKSQIDIIKKQMAMIGQMQNNRNVISTRQYVAFLEENIQQKLSALQLLRQNLAQFTYKLDQLEEVQERVKSIVGTHFEDQQLLDDLS